MRRVAAKPIVDPDQSIHSQLEMFGVEGLRQKLVEEHREDPLALKRGLERVEAAFKSSVLVDDVSFLHAGLCQTGLPHSRPKDDEAVWQRSNGRFHLIVEPGTIINSKNGLATRVGVPYGAKARLIFMYINTQGVISRSVSLGKSMSAWMRRLGLHVTGGSEGSIRLLKEQTLRLGRARFSFQFEHDNGGMDIRDTQIADELCLWVTDEGAWVEEIELTAKFHEHLMRHAVPMCDHAIAHLSGSSLKLDLYAWAAWRLPRLQKPLTLPWLQVASTFAVAGPPHKVAEKVKEALPDVYDVYRDMRIEVSRRGLVLYPSHPPIPKRMIVVPPGLPM